MNLNYVAFGKRIRELRVKRGWKQQTLAEKSGIEASNLSHIECTATKLGFPTLVSIANVLEVSLDELVYDSLIKNEHISIKEINDLVSDCNSKELSAIIEIIKTTKSILRNIENQTQFT